MVKQCAATYSNVLEGLQTEVPGVDAKLVNEYVVIQLLSDAGYLLGNRSRALPDRKEDFRWRALWDVYIASLVSARYGYVTPRPPSSFREILAERLSRIWCCPR